MMKTKMFEIRDRATCIPVIAIKTEGETLEEHMFFRRGGWCCNSVFLININGDTVETHVTF